MIFQDMYQKALRTLDRLNLGFAHRDTYRQGGKGGPKGEIFLRLDHADGRVETRHIKNVITRDFSLLMARLAKDPSEPRHGIYALAVGSGDTGWDLQNPPPQTNLQRALYAEIGRKAFSETYFVDDAGAPSLIPSTTIDFTAIFAENEAVGPIAEMGLVGGDVNDDTAITNPIAPPYGPWDASVDVVGKDTLCNYLTFPVINKPATARLTLTWRISF